MSEYRRSMNVWSVTVTDPSRRTRILAQHVSLSIGEALALVQIYLALGYDAEHVLITAGAAVRVA